MIGIYRKRGDRYTMEKNSEELASLLSYEIVKEVAPDELDLFDDFKEEFLKNRDAFLEKDPKKKEKMLGFGGGVGEVFLTMIILPLVLGVIKDIGIAGIKALKEAVAEKIKDTIDGKKDFSSNEKMKELRRYICQNASSMGVDKEIAGVIADSFIGKLTLMGIQ